MHTPLSQQQYQALAQARGARQSLVSFLLLACVCLLAAWLVHRPRARLACGAFAAMLLFLALVAALRLWLLRRPRQVELFKQ
jgi:Flp pilus assembly protein TadB